MRALLVLCVLALTACESTIAPPWPADDFGSSMALVDITCDGMTDVVVGSPGADRIDIYAGTATTVSTQPISQYGPTRGAGFGFVVVGVPDTNGDACDDLIQIGAVDRSAQLFLGSSSGVLGDPVWTDDTENWRSAAGGDVDEDGLGDVLLGSNNEARVYLGTASGLSATEWFRIREQDLPGSGTREFGERVAMAYIDGDNSLDFVIADPEYDSGGGSQHGRVYGVQNEDLPDAPDPVDSLAILADGSEPGDHAGRRMVFGDFDNNGMSEMILGFPNRTAGGIEGAVEFFDEPLTEGNANNDIEGQPGDGDFGAGVAIADIDNDGVLDLLVGAPNFGVPGISNTGRIRVYERIEVFTSSSATPFLEVTGAEDQRWGADLLAAPADTAGVRWLVGMPLRNVSPQGAAGVFIVDGTLPDGPNWIGTGQ